MPSYFAFHISVVTFSLFSFLSAFKIPSIPPHRFPSNYLPVCLTILLPTYQPTYLSELLFIYPTIYLPAGHQTFISCVLSENVLFPFLSFPFHVSDIRNPPLYPSTSLRLSFSPSHALHSSPLAPTFLLASPSLVPPSPRQILSSLPPFAQSAFCFLSLALYQISTTFFFFFSTFMHTHKQTFCANFQNLTNVFFCNPRFSSSSQPSTFFQSHGVVHDYGRSHSNFRPIAT